MPTVWTLKGLLPLSRSLMESFCTVLHCCTEQGNSEWTTLTECGHKQNSPHFRSKMEEAEEEGEDVRRREGGATERNTKVGRKTNTPVEKKKK